MCIVCWGVYLLQADTAPCSLRERNYVFLHTLRGAKPAIWVEAHWFWEQDRVAVGEVCAHADGRARGYRPLSELKWVVRRDTDQARSN